MNKRQYFFSNTGAEGDSPRPLMDEFGFDKALIKYSKDLQKELNEKINALQTVNKEEVITIINKTLFE